MKGALNFQNGSFGELLSGQGQRDSFIGCPLAIHQCRFAMPALGNFRRQHTEERATEYRLKS